MQWRKCRGRGEVQAAHRLIPGMCKVMRTLSLRMRAERRVTKRGYQDPEECASTGDCRGSLRRVPEKSRAT